MSDKNDYKWMVRVQCMTFNHALFIEDTMNGFTMQQTDFPFVCTIIDDASTDGEQKVIKNYLNEHFDLEDANIVRHEETEDYLLTFARHKTNLNCYFTVLFLKYNHYSIKKPKLPYIGEWNDNVKYIAWCEGDDYWVDSCKLQKQVDFLEKNDCCVMVCNRAKRYSVEKQYFLDDSRCYNQSQFVSPENIIEKGGLYITTCSMLCKKTVLDNYPEYCKQCHVGDYPLQIWCAMTGGVYYFDIPMSVYRVDNPLSWVGKVRLQKKILENKIKGIRSEVDMLHGFCEDFPCYKESFSKRINHYILINHPNRIRDHEGYVKYKMEFKEELKQFSFKGTILLSLKTSLLSKLYYLYIWIEKYAKV